VHPIIIMVHSHYKSVYILSGLPAPKLRTRYTNVVHDLGSADPRSKVEPSSRWITLHQVELGSADPVQLNGRGYTVDDADWSTTLGLQWRHSRT